MSMFESSVSWLTVPITQTSSFGKTITRRGNTHEFFAPVSVYQAKDGFVYLAVGNDRQWKSMVGLEPFRELDKPEYEKNQGRIRDVKHLNSAINNITKNYLSEELIEMFRSITVPISKIHTIPEVLEDPLVKKILLRSKDPVTGKEITLAPPPNMTPFLKQSNKELSFPPRFGEHNELIFGEKLGYSQQKLQELKGKGVI